MSRAARKWSFQPNFDDFGRVFTRDESGAEADVMSLCSRDRRAETFSTKAARIPSTLLAAIDMPMPLPQIRTTVGTFGAGLSDALTSRSALSDND